jgi:ubiquinone/menaquinone biosynthesis C-methylase UbiE
MVRRRELVKAALGARRGERVLDIGCGPGFYAAELAPEVGPEGAIVAVDRSPQMLALARRRCEGLGHVTFHEGEATSLPVEDGGFDAAFSVQVLEYVQEIDAALAEMHRALRPGGRAVVWDVDWSTVSLYSPDAARTARVLRAWDEHLTHPSLPQTLTARLRAAGFEDVAVAGHAFVTNELVPDTYGGSLVPLVEDYVAGDARVGDEEARDWAAEQRELDRRGEFFFACIQFCFTARR